MLKAEGLHVSINGVEILRGVTLTVARGTIVCLLGRNGAGKTTTIKTIMGFYKPVKGRVTIDNMELTSKSVHERVKYGVSYAPEDLRIFPWLTVEENIKLAAKLAGRNVDEAIEIALGVFPEIRGFLKRQGFYLSGGEKRMVAIARALAQNPKYMLLDELLEGLAPIVVERLSKALREIASKGVGILIAESNVMLAKRIVDEAYIIERGEIIYSGSIDKALETENIARILG
ncbi:MAG: ABC transporter ATP-binding protein, partial [Acidilobaceae archaeon]